MKSKIVIICLLLISVYCLSAVCAADLNQTSDDIKTNDENEGNVVLVNDDNDVCDISCEDGTADDVAKVKVDSKINGHRDYRDFRYIPSKPPKKGVKRGLLI